MFFSTLKKKKKKKTKTKNSWDPFDVYVTTAGECEKTDSPTK